MGIAVAMVALFTFALPADVVARNYSIVPEPAYMDIEAEGDYVVTAKTRIVVNDEAWNPAERFAEDMMPYFGLKKPMHTAKRGKGIKVRIDQFVPAEGYEMTISEEGIVIIGGSEAGIYYGLQTLRQIIVTNDGKVPYGFIADEPTFAYRGAHLDVSRHFFSVEDVKRYIDIIAAHKLNRLHWHLTDDQGWRIEIKAYPELTELGSQRKETLIGHGLNPVEWDGTPYGGYYTQDEIRDIVAYAAERYIEVIPEIDMPGHMIAALATYPELGCTKGPYEVRKTWGIAKDVLCAGRETTFAFIEDVLDEVVALFPSKYIHIGGDECPKNRWKECPDCQKRIQEEGLKDEHELQSYFMKRVEKYLNTKHGRSIIGWDEILEGGVSKTATVMAWRGAKRGVLAAKLGNNVIMTPTHYCYLDFANTSNREKNGEPICGGRNGKRPLTLRKVYSFDPYADLTTDEQRCIVGVQGNLWTEYIADFDHAQRMTLPRIAAIAEVGWTPMANKSYNDFSRRMHLLRKLYDKCGYKYAPYFFNGIE